MRAHILAIIVTSLVAITSVAQSQELLTLTLDEAIELALSENPTIKIAELEVERYDYVKRETMGALLPQVSIDGTYNRTLQSQSMARGFSFGGDQYNTITGTGNISLALYSPAVYRTLRMNDTEMAAAVESARASRVDLVAAVKSSLYAVMLAESSLEVLLESSATSKQSVDETQVMYDNGVASEYDLLTAQVQYSNLQPSILQAQSSIVIAKEQLKVYLSLPQSVDIEIDEEFEQLRAKAAESSRELSQDLSDNTSLRSLEFTEQLLEHQLRINNASRLPTLGAYGYISHTGNDMESFSIDGSDVEESTERYYWQSPAAAGLSLSIPIFGGGSRTARSRQIENQIAQIVAQQQYTEDNLSMSLRSTIDTIHTAEEKVVADRQTVEQARKAYTISNVRYQAGAGTMLELNSARLSLTQAELNLTQAIYDLLVARSEYERIIGVER